MTHLCCLSCDHTWQAFDHDGCPECGSKEIFVEDEELPEDGHYEGGFASNSHAQDYGE